MCLLLVARSLTENSLLLDYQVNDAAILQALFCHAFDAAHVAAPIDIALKHLHQLLNDLQRGGENIVFAAPVAFGLAHDLTPALNAVAKQVMCIEAELGARQIDKESLRKVLDELKRAESRFKVCRSRLQSIATLFKQTRTRRERCYLNSIIEEVHEWLSPDFTDYAVAFEFPRNNRVADDLIHADKPQVFQVVYNLIANALKALRAIPKHNRRISVRTSQPEDRETIEVSVTDTAGSLTAEVHAHMYEPFFSTDVNGTGLGLWIVRSILDRLGVTPEVHVRPSASTTFRILLPREW